MIASLHTWIAGVRRYRIGATRKATDAGVLVQPVQYAPLLDDIGERDGVACWRLRGEDDRHYKHRLAVHLQEQILLRDAFNHLLDQVLKVRV